MTCNFRWNAIGTIDDGRSLAQEQKNAEVVATHDGGQFASPFGTLDEWVAMASSMITLVVLMVGSAEAATMPSSTSPTNFTRGPECLNISQQRSSLSSTVTNRRREDRDRTPRL